MKTTYKFFKFLENRKGKKIPFGAKLIHAPETLTEEDLHIKGSLNLSNTTIQSLPKGLEVEKGLDLSHSSIQSLPKGLKVGRYLGLFGTPIRALPEDLTIGGDLYLYNSSIESLPRGLRIKKDIYLRNTPLSKKYTEEEVRKKIEETGGYIKGEIFL